ncbi:poliovirus receptor homolog [Lissotriton helveticus]
MARLARWMASLCLLTLLAEGQVSWQRAPVVRVAPTVFGSLMDEVSLRCALVPASSDVAKVSWSVVTNGDRVQVAVFERDGRPSYPLERRPGRLEFRSSLPTEDAALIIRSLTVKDGGTYYCTFDLPQRRAEEPTTLIITATPNNSAHAVPAAGGTPGLAVVAICTSARGLPPAKITWRSELLFDVNTTETVNTDGTVSVQSHLLVSPTVQVHNQRVTCEISNKPGAVQESIEVFLSITCEKSPSIHRTPVWAPSVSIWVCVGLLATMAFLGFTIMYSQCPRTKALPPDERYPSCREDTALERCTTKL